VLQHNACHKVLFPVNKKTKRKKNQNENVDGKRNKQNFGFRFFHIPPALEAAEESSSIAFQLFGCLVGEFCLNLTEITGRVVSRFIPFQGFLSCLLITTKQPFENGISRLKL